MKPTISLDATTKPLSKHAAPPDSNPQAWLAYFWLGQALRDKKLYAEAIEAFGRGRDLTRNNPAMIALYGHAEGLSGNATEARAALHALEQMRATRFVPSIYLAAVHLGLGETNRAVSTDILHFRARVLAVDGQRLFIGSL